MQINDNYHVVKGPNDLDYCLVYKYTGKTREGEDREAQKVLGYFPSIDNVIAKLVKLETIDNINVDTLEELKQKLDELEKSIKETINAE